MTMVVITIVLIATMMPIMVVNTRRPAPMLLLTPAAACPQQGAPGLRYLDRHGKIVPW